LQEQQMFNPRRVFSRLRDSKGQTMTEYALLAAGIGLAAVAGYGGLGNSTNTAIGAASALIAGSPAQTGAGTGTTGSSGSSGGDEGSGDGDSGSGDGHGHHHHGGGGGWGGWGGHHF
jgi:Flp pilus assembly pilin Flp